MRERRLNSSCIRDLSSTLSVCLQMDLALGVPQKGVRENRSKTTKSVWRADVTCAYFLSFFALLDEQRKGERKIKSRIRLESKYIVLLNLNQMHFILYNLPTMPSQSFFSNVILIDRLSESCVSNAMSMLDAILIFAIQFYSFLIYFFGRFIYIFNVKDDCETQLKSVQCFTFFSSPALP